MKVVVHVDGGRLRGNSRPAAAAAVISTAEGEVIATDSALLGVV